ncbi:MAG: DNA recombination protein RmuC [Candidatus Paceibacterota bacterium]|jgi:DNA recombination protein RmuC
MNTVIFIVVGLVVGFALAVIAVKFFGSKKEENGTDNSAMMLLQNQIENLTKTIDSRLHETNKQSAESVREQFSEFARLSREVTEKLVRLEETNKQVINFTDQLQSLQDILKNPKQRGILGEYYLETLLKNVLPPGSYQMQYPFPDGTIVDAVVFVKDKIIPIDSKFSLENYNRIVEEKSPAEKEKLEKIFVNDLKNRISETAKYVQPDRGTMEFAFMFIPHEAIYYDLIINKIGALKDENTENLIQRAASKYHVIIVSPTSFLAYLQTVLQGLKALQIEESAKEIRQRVEELGKHIGAYESYMAKLGGALGTTVSHYNLAYKELKKVDKDVLRVTGVSAGFETQTLDKPNLED